MVRDLVLGTQSSVLSSSALDMLCLYFGTIVREGWKARYELVLKTHFYPFCRVHKYRNHYLMTKTDWMVYITTELRVDEAFIGLLGVLLGSTWKQVNVTQSTSRFFSSKMHYSERNYKFFE